MNKLVCFVITFIALTLVAPAAMAQGMDIPPPPGGGGTKAPPAATATATGTEKPPKKEYKDPCAGQPGTKWCVVLKKCVSTADFDKECKKEEEKKADDDKNKEGDCGELGTVTDATTGKTRCKTLKEIIAEVIKEQKQGGPMDENGNCLFGPFPKESADESADESAATAEPTVCYTYEQAREKGDHSTLLLILVLLSLGGVGGSFVQSHRIHKKTRDVTEALDAWLKAKKAEEAAAKAAAQPPTPAAAPPPPSSTP